MDTNKRTMICPKCGAENLSWRWRCQTCGTLLQEEDISAGKFDRWGDGEWLALILGLIGAGVWTLAMVGLFSVNLLFILVVLIPWVGLALAWKRPFIGGVVLIVVGSVTAYALVGLRGGDILFLLAGLPFLVCGVLFILSWREGREALTSSASSEGKSRQY